MTADGVQIIISIQNEREWASFAGRIMGHPEWAREGPFRLNVERVKNRPALEREVAAVFAAATGAEMQDRLREARIAYGVVNPVAELSRHPVLRRVAVATPSGPAAIPAPPVRAKGGATATLGAVPGLGEHTERLRKEFAA
jgi:crotonobetainyl-CoA:carnitine CoA-transferase CaiB-like acyl-CoA transferase